MAKPYKKRMVEKKIQIAPGDSNLGSALTPAAAFQTQNGMRVLVSYRRIVLRLDAIEVAKETGMKEVSSMATAAAGMDPGRRIRPA